MKKNRISFVVLILFITASLSLYSQEKGKLLVISNLSSEVIIDGNNMGTVEENQPFIIEIEVGEHYLQVKSKDAGKVLEKNEIITIELNKQKVIKIDFEITKSPQDGNLMNNLKNDTITVATLDFYAPVLEDKIYDYAFAAGDEIIVDIEITEKRGSLKLDISEYPDNKKYSSVSFRKLKNIKIKANKKSIYRFTISANALIMKGCKMTIKRIPANESTINFNTNVRYVEEVDTNYTSQVKQILLSRDTIYSEVINRNLRLYSQNSLDGLSKTYIDIQLPQGTGYWVYWIGVGQKSAQQMKDLAQSLSDVSNLVPNPIAAFGLGLIPSLPILNTTATVNYRFMDLQNKNLFMANQQYRYYTFKEGRNFSSDYAKINIENTPKGKLYMCFWNEDDWSGHDVNIQIGAFIFKDAYRTETVKIPTSVERKQVPIFEE